MSTRTNLFQVGGAIPIGRLYIERKADTELVERLLEGEFCHILAPRQIGKSSLRLRAAKTLEQHGIRCVSIDFSGIGSSSVTVDEWYFSIAYEIAEELGLPNPELFWTQHDQLTPVHRWYRFIRNELLDRIDEQVVVFIDEVDSVLALSFTTDDFFSSIRSAYNLRAEDPAYRRLTFCLLGVAAPTDLIQNPVRTPFNIGRGIRIEDFTWSELDAFTPGLTHLGGDIQLLLATIYAWTSGHPYMTQRICEELARQGSLGGRSESDAVDEAAYQIFLRSGRSSDPTLAYVEKRLDMNTSRVRVRQMLHIYRKLLAGERVQVEPNSPIQTELRLMGLAGEDPVSPHPLLRTRNLIFAEVYDLGWLKSKEKEHRLAESVERWLSSGKLDDWLLRGAALEDALSWARGRIDLTTAEHEFLLACVTLARREAEERHRSAEALRKEEAARRSLVEQQRRVEEQRYITDIERERRQRAEDAAQSQNRVISILTVTVAALGALVAVGVWQFILARTAREELDEAREEAQREATDARLLKAASEAVLLAQTPGMETKALITAIDAAGQALRSGRKIPGRIREGIAAAVATSPRRAQILRHGDRINSARFSHDGTRVLTASRDRSARIWDAASGKSIAVFDEHGESVRSAVFSRDDTKILTASGDRSARLYSASSGNVLALFQTHDPTLARADLSPDGRRVLTVSMTKAPRLWDAQSGEAVATLKGLRGSVAATFSPSGASILTWNTYGAVKLWSGTTGQAIADLPSHNRQLRVAEFSPNDQRIVTAGDDLTVRLLNGTGAVITTLKGHRGAITGAVFSPESGKLMTYDDDGLAILWESQSGREIVRLVGHLEGITGGAFASEGSLVVTTSADGTAKLWRSDSGALQSTLIGHGGPVRGAAFSPSADRLATYGADKNVRLWSPQSGDLLGVLDGHTEDILRVEFSPSGQSLLTVSADNTARVWDTSLQSPIPTLKGHRLSIRVAGFSPDMKRIVTGSDDRSVRLHDGATYGAIETLSGHQGPVIGLAFAPRGGDRFLTFAEDDPVGRLWDLEDGRLIAELKGHVAPILAATFSSDGSEVITAGADDTTRRWRAVDGQAGSVCAGTTGALSMAALSSGGVNLISVGRDAPSVQLWRADSCTFIDALQGHTGPVDRAIFSDDAQVVATSGVDGTTRLWNTRYGTSLRTFESEYGPVQVLAISPDGSRLLSNGFRDARVWDTGSERLVATLSGHSGAVLAGAYSGDGTLIVTASGDNTARLWDTTTSNYELIATLAGHTAAILVADFSSDDRYVITASRDSSAKIYPTRLIDYLERGCELLRAHPDQLAQAPFCMVRAK